MCEFIANPADLQKRYAWNKVQDELKALARPSFRRVADHIDHAVEIAGIDHVGIGSDFDGIEVTRTTNPDGSKKIEFVNEKRGKTITETITPEGKRTTVTETKAKNNTVTRITEGPNGKKTVETTKPDGTKITKHPDGTKVTETPNKNGTKDVVVKDKANL